MFEFFLGVIVTVILGPSMKFFYDQIARDVREFGFKEVFCAKKN